MSHLDEGTLHAMLDGELEPNEVAEIQAHLASCSSCGLRLREVREFLDEADRLIASVEMDGAAAAPRCGARRRSGDARDGAGRAAAPASRRASEPVRSRSRRAAGEPVRSEPARSEPPRAEAPCRGRRMPRRAVPRARCARHLPPRAAAGARPAGRQGDVERAAAPAADARQRIGCRPAHAAGAGSTAGRR